MTEKRKQNNKLMKKEARDASLQHIRRVDKMLEFYWPDGLEFFHNWKVLESLNVLEGCKTGKWPEHIPVPSEDFMVTCLNLITDQEQYEVTGGECIFGPEPECMGCTGNRLRDEFHRWSNDLELAINLCGLGTVEQAGILLMNIGYGPWQRAYFFQLVAATGKCIPKLFGPNMKFQKHVIIRIVVWHLWQVL